MGVMMVMQNEDNIEGSAQDCGNSIPNALELPQSCAKRSIYTVKSLI